ncbi:hypothetical protein [Siccirubricoccus phaeus]|uniref:hypothetical protein n=1 Tax=Siccirubricoccus phaeus TaxID=2595053 RepID=UPI0011F2CC56|nr:hypothetical protein [Siccirubricoccus phaeus]
MNVVVDACSLINLSNASALGLVCQLQRCRFWIAAGAAGECEGDCARQLLSLVATGTLHRVDDTTISAARVLELLARYGLGQGETESIAACEEHGFVFCSDDKLARGLGTSLLGTKRVIGCLRLLRWCVEERIIECMAAIDLQGVMRDRGGFLPKMEQKFFCTGIAGC